MKMLFDEILMLEFVIYIICTSEIRKATMHKFFSF
jgi:hypothetical protein